jgi:hypothetical protein
VESTFLPKPGVNGGKFSAAERRNYNIQHYRTKNIFHWILKKPAPEQKSPPEKIRQAVCRQIFQDGGGDQAGFFFLVAIL